MFEHRRGEASNVWSGPSTRASLASSVVGSGTAGSGAEMSPPIAGGTRHGGLSGGNGGSIPIKTSGGFQECGHHKEWMHGVRPTLNPSLDSTDISCLLTFAQGQTTCLSKRRAKWHFRLASALCSVGRKNNMEQAWLQRRISLVATNVKQRLSVPR